MATRKIDLEIALQGEREFNQQMKSINSGLSVLRSDMQLCSAEFKDNASSVEALTRQSEIWEKQVDQQKEKVNALTQFVDKQKEKFGENSAQVDKYSKELNKAQAELLSMERAQRQTNQALDSAKNSYGSYKAEVSQSDSALSLLQSRLNLVNEQLKHNADNEDLAAKKAEILKRAYEESREKVDALSDELNAMNEVTGGATEETDKLEKELNDARVAMIKAKAAMDEYNESQQKTEAENEKYKTQLDRLKEKLGEIKQKLSEKAAAFKEAAMQVPGLSDALQVLGPVLTTTAKGFAAVTTAAAAFGAGAVAITGVALATGVKTLTTWANEAAESAKAAAEAGETLDWTQQQWLAYSNSLDIFTAKATSAKSAIATILLPALQDFTTVGADILNDFTAEMEQAAGNPEMMGQVIAEYITVAAQEIQNQLPQLLNLARDLLSGLEQGFEENGDQLEAAVSEIISMFVDFVVDCAPMIGEAAAEIITFLAEALIDNAPEIIEAGVELMINLLQGLIEGLPEILAKIPGMLGEILMTILSAVPQFLVAGANLMTALWEGIKSVINQIGSWISETVSGWANSISNFMGNGSGSIVSNVQSRYSGFATGLTNVPYDDFPALLHKGEAVLTASQAREWRAGEGTHSGSSASFTVPIKFEISNDIDGMTLSRKLYSYNLTVDNIHGTKLTKTGSTN